MPVNSTIGRDGLALALAAAAVAIRLMLAPWIEHGQVAFLALPAAMAISVWFGGYRAGIITAVSGYAACDYLFINDIGFGPYQSLDFVRMAAFTVSSVIIIGFGDAARIVAATRKRERDAEAERRTQEQFRKMADGAPVLVWMSGLDKKCIWFNKQWLEFVGRPMEQELGDGWSQNVHPDDARRCVHTYVTSFDIRRPFSMEYRLRRADGEYRWILDNGVPTFDDGGEFTGYIGSCIDITDRTRAERALQSTQERFSRFMRHLPGLAWIKDVQGRYVFANDAAVKAFGIPREALIGKTDAEIFPDDVARQFVENDRRAMANGVGVQTVEQLEHEDGLLHHSLVGKFPIPGPTGDAEWVGGIAIDITERRRAEEALRDADRRKSDFLATLSHELRNPLAPIRNSLELVRHSGHDASVVTRSLDVMDRQVSHMVRLVDDLLDINRITADRLELRRSRVVLSDVLDQAIETCADLIERGGHAVDISGQPASVVVNADPVRLVQVFSNLINNACKYSSRPGAIRIAVRTVGPDAEVSITDDGIGISSGSLESIFEMFAQGDTGTENSRNSLGIGLTLVKRLVELHGGKVEARSDGPGRGSEFVVTLPLAAETAVVEMAQTDAPSAAPITPFRVLVVDDNEDSAESLAMLLTFGGHNVATAHEGHEALRVAEQFRPQVAILDVGLPTLDGHELCRRMRARSWGRDVFIVALTGWGQEEDRRKSREAGFDDHFVKPLNHADLLQRLRSVPVPKQ